MEHKYRAWDGFNSEYIYSDNMNAPNEMLKIARFFENCAYAVDGGNEIIIEQFTGLHDKNGKEIYEGDIVEYEHINGDIEPNIFRWSEVKARFLFGKYGVQNNEPERWEIIGNIHENPELLEQ